MIWLILLSVITYIRSLFSGFISDDVQVNGEMRRSKYPIRFKDIFISPIHIPHDIVWKLFKEKPFLHHSLSLVIYTILVCSFYLVLQKFFPQKIAFYASLIFTVHPCNAQVVGWISGKWYAVSGIIALWAVYFNNIILYLVSFVFGLSAFALPLVMNLSLPTKLASMGLVLLITYRLFQTKSQTTSSEGVYKTDNLRIYPRKLMVILKSFSYYFTLVLFPFKMGWFHELGEPIDKKLKSFNFHAVLSVLLIGSVCLFIGKPAFIGLFLFCIFIAPFCNLVTPALFTSERYMTFAIMGWSIFLATVLHNYPMILVVLITAYFMRTQLELWGYKDDFHLALYSLLNFNKSGFAWANLANLMLNQRKPSAAYSFLQEGISQCPEFPTNYFTLYRMFRATDLLCDFDKALENLEKACHYGGHEGWYEELEDFKTKLRQVRTQRFKESCDTGNKNVSQLGAGAQSDTSSISPELTGVAK